MAVRLAWAYILHIIAADIPGSALHYTHSGLIPCQDNLQVSITVKVYKF